MGDVHRLPEERQVLQEASQWIARLNADDVTAEDRERFDVWRRAHPMHARVFDELASTWHRFATKRSLVRAVVFGRSMSEGSVLPGRSIRARNVSRGALAAAAIALMVGLGWFAYRRVTAGRIYETGIGEHATISLADGSTLELDSDSRARVDFSARSRVVHLDRGEAFFKIVHNPARPLWVISGGMWVRDIGTAFNVRMGASGVQVAVTQGTVQIGAIDRLLQDIPFERALLREQPVLSEIAAGHLVELRGARLDIRRLTARQLARLVSWRAGTLYFEDQPLLQVVRQLRRYTPLHIVVRDPHLRQLALAGTFKASPQGVQTFLKMLSQGLGLRVRRESNRVVIEPTGKSSP